LLIVLQSEVSVKLPIDARTILKTTSSVMVRRMGTGQYYYFGIGKFLVKKIEAGLSTEEGSFPIILNIRSTRTDKIISLSVGIDGNSFLYLVLTYLLLLRKCVLLPLENRLSDYICIPFG
jgi:hypothetical protein